MEGEGEEEAGRGRGREEEGGTAMWLLLSQIKIRLGGRKIMKKRERGEGGKGGDMRDGISFSITDLRQPPSLLPSYPRTSEVLEVVTNTPSFPPPRLTSFANYDTLEVCVCVCVWYRRPDNLLHIKHID